MATIKSFTDIPQSKKLAEILPLESADMYYEDDISVEFGHGWHSQHIPCWSLSALLGVLPEGTILLKSTNISSIDDIKYHCECHKINIDKWFDNPVDACYEMILKLHELNLL